MVAIDLGRSRVVEGLRWWIAILHGLWGITRRARVLGLRVVERLVLRHVCNVLSGVVIGVDGRRRHGACWTALHVLLLSGGDVLV